MSNENIPSVTISGKGSFQAVKQWCEKFNIQVRVSPTTYKDVTLVKGKSAPNVGVAFSSTGWTVRSV